MPKAGSRGPISTLILGGTAEAAELAAICAARPNLVPISSLAGRTRSPRLPSGDVRFGGFGGGEGLQRFMAAEAIDRVVDATHPFAARISEQAAAACSLAGVPRLRLLRPAWRRRQGDRWHEVADMAAAARELAAYGRRVLLSVGHQELEAFAELADVWFLVRTIEPPASRPLPRAQWLCGRGPFQLADELDLLRRHRIEVLVTKASGGDATYPKLAAARTLGLPVIMLQRPPPPPGPVVDTVHAALAWLEDPSQRDEAGGRNT